MGIRNLLRWVQWISLSQPQPQQQQPQPQPQPVQWLALQGKRIGIDILSILYKARAEKQPVLDIVAGLVKNLRALDIEPVFVFDGKSPREKDGTRSARRRQKERLAETVQDSLRISTDDRNQVKQLLYALGCLALNAEGEADAVLAFLARRGDLAAVVSSDMDFLPRGIACLLLPNSLTDITAWRSITLSTLLTSARLSYEAFVEMCVLMGCDYAPTIPTISYQSAYWMIRAGNPMLEILENEGIRTATAWETAIVILRGTRDRWEDIVSERQREKWLAGPPPAEPDAPILATLLYGHH